MVVTNEIELSTAACSEISAGAGKSYYCVPVFIIFERMHEKLDVPEDAFDDKTEEEKTELAKNPVLKVLHPFDLKLKAVFRTPP